MTINKPCPECDGEGVVEGYTAIPWRVGPTVTCPVCHGWSVVPVAEDEDGLELIETEPGINHALHPEN